MLVQDNRSLLPNCAARKEKNGVLGSQNTGGFHYPTYPRLENSGSAVFGDNIIAGYSLKYLPRNLSWEKTHAWEAGLEIAFFGNRLRIEPVYYNKVTKDIIVLLSGFSGAKNSLENLGEIRNRGMELSASWSDKIGESGLKYTVSGNLTTIDIRCFRSDISLDRKSVV